MNMFIGARWLIGVINKKHAIHLSPNAVMCLMLTHTISSGCAALDRCYLSCRTLGLISLPVRVQLQGKTMCAARRWVITAYFTPRPASRCIGYSKENLKIHTGVTSPPFLPSLTLPPPSSPPPAFPSLSPSPPFLYPLPLEVGPLKSS